MRALERFLVAFALISLIMRILGLRDASTMELIAFSVLALFYLIGFPFFLRPVPGLERKQGGMHWALAFGSGIGLAYCLLSLLCYTLGWVTATDMLVNGSLICAFFLAGSWWAKSRGHVQWMLLFRRAAILWIFLLAIAFIPLPEIGSLSRGPLQ